MPMDANDTEITVQHVPVNMYETEGAIVIVAPLPGVQAEDIEVRIDHGKVSIDAAMRSEAPGKDYLLHEWHYGPYHRDVELPEGFGADSNASYGNGHIAVRIGRGEPTAESVVIKPSR